MSTSKLAAFTERLRKYCRGHGLTATRWQGASRRTANLVEIDTAPRRTVLYVKDRSEPPGFWGLNESQLDALRQSRSAWYVVLLVGSGEKGFLLSSDQVEKAIRTKKWTRSGTDWKVHEGAEITGSLKFNGFETLFEAAFDR